ncbi:MAG: cobP [Paenibacillaceae bacterium]|jgi:adenosylcobinamide kinase/adenosylcobinamide-phosphate guanylyltransferase|nr:cobP [Paenibacillaceae bacterium]
MLVLITGGARSGKSGFAEVYAAEFSETGYYIATCQALDEEMEERIALHLTKREQDQAIFWHTVEEPLELSAALRAMDRAANRSGPQVVLVDCLTLWLSNVLLAEEEEEWDKAARQRAAQRAEEAIDGLIERLLTVRHHVLLVTNEVGSGIVPEYPLGRLYRDLAGAMNRRVAAICQEVYLVTAGIPVELKRLQKELASGRAGAADASDQPELGEV